MDILDIMMAKKLAGGGSSGEGDAVKYTSQTLTESQQMQARKNQGLYREEKELIGDIVWDNHTEGLRAFTFLDTSYKISNVVLTKEQLQSCIFMYEGEELLVNIENFENSVPGIYVISGLNKDDENDSLAYFSLVSSKAGTINIFSYLSIEIPEDGTYCGVIRNPKDLYAEPFNPGEASITFPNIEITTVHGVEPRYLPEGGFGYVDDFEPDPIITWDGDTEGRTYIDLPLGKFYKVSDSIFSGESLIGKNIRVYMNGVTQDYLITQDFPPNDGEAAIEYWGSGLAAISYLDGTPIDPIPIIISAYEGYSEERGFEVPEDGTYFISVEDSDMILRTMELQIPGSTTIHKIDPKYLPINDLDFQIVFTADENSFESNNGIDTYYVSCNKTYDEIWEAIFDDKKNFVARLDLPYDESLFNLNVTPDLYFTTDWMIVDAGDVPIHQNIIITPDDHDTGWVCAMIRFGHTPPLVYDQETDTFSNVPATEEYVNQQIASAIGDAIGGEY